MLIVKDIYYSYKNNTVLEGISLSLHSGVYGLLGPNGSGKTTLLRCISGIITPQKGTIYKPEKIGYLPQNFGMFPELTVYETLDYFAAIKQIPKQNRNESINTTLAMVNLEKDMHKKIGSLSGGMLRRLGIAQAIMDNPDLIIFDEPTTGLDPEERLRFKNIIATIREKQTIIIATHLVDDVDALCDRIILLSNGSVVCEESKENLQNCANGCVYKISFKEKTKLNTPYTITTEERVNDIDYLRVLSPIQQPGNKVQPTLEDGYMFAIKGYYETRNNKNCILEK